MLTFSCPQMISTINYQRDGFMAINNQGGAPNYFPNSFSGPEECPAVRSPSFQANGSVDRHEPVNEDDFGQATKLWRDVFDADAKTRFVNNVVGHLKDASVFIIERAVKNFTNVDAELGKRLIDGLRKSGVPINNSGRSANL